MLHSAIVLQHNTCGVALGNNGLLPAAAVSAVGMATVGTAPGVSAIDEATEGILQQ